MVVFDIDDCISKLLQKRLLGEALLREICEKTKEVLMRESNVVHVAAPVTVVGDIHGCALPLLAMFKPRNLGGLTDRLVVPFGGADNSTIWSRSFV